MSKQSCLYNSSIAPVDTNSHDTRVLLSSHNVSFPIHKTSLGITGLHRTSSEFDQATLGWSLGASMTSLVSLVYFFQYIRDNSIMKAISTDTASLSGPKLIIAYDYPAGLLSLWGITWPGQWVVWKERLANKGFKSVLFCFELNCSGTFLKSRPV